MKHVGRFIAGAAIAAITWATGSAHAQCSNVYPPYPGSQLDFDFLLGTLDTVLGRVLFDTATNVNLWTGINVGTGLPQGGVTPVWQKIPGQVGPGFKNVDNWGNQIHDDDHLDFLAAILDGDASVVAGIPGATVTKIRNDFAANRDLIKTREITINPVRVRATALGTTCSNNNVSVTTNSTVNIVLSGGLLCGALPTLSFDLDSLWTQGAESGLLADADPMLEQYLLDLGAAILTIGDPEGVTWFQDLLGEVTLEFVRVLVPGLLENLKADYDAEIDFDFDGSGFEGDDKLDCTTPPPDIFVNLAGTVVEGITLGNPSDILLTGANACARINTYVTGFNCTNFTCNNSLLGATGNVTGTGSSNLAAYILTAGNRQDWMLAKGFANPPLEITSQPSNVGVLSGQTVNMTYTVVGSPTNYSWETVDPEFFTTSGTPFRTTAALSLPYAIPSDSGLYSGIACDGRWTRRTLPATLAVTPQAFAVTQQPTPVTATALVGGNVTFTTNVTGGFAVPTYQWRRGVTNLDGVANPSALTRILNLTNVQLADAGQYNCVITGDDGAKAVVNLTTNNATLTVLTPLVIGTQPVGANIVRGGGHVLTVGGITGGTGNPVNYQWQRNGVNLTNNPPHLTGVNTATLTISDALFTQQGNYRCVVTDPTPGLTQSVTSNAVAVTVLGISSTGNLPLFVSRAVGAPFTLTVVPVGGAVAAPGTEASPPNPNQYTYEWEFDQAPASGNWVTLGAFTTNTLTIASATPPDSGKYRVTVRDTALVAVTSSETNVTVSSNPIVIGTQPQGAGRLTGSSVTFNTTATGGAPTPNNLTFVWYRNGSPITIGGDVSVSSTGTTSSLTINNLDEAAHAGAIFCRISDAQSQIIDTNTVQLYVGDPLAVTTNPVGANRYTGQGLVLEVATSGGVGPVSYQWFQGATPVGLDSPVLDLSPATPLAVGSYTCQIRDIGVGDGDPSTYTATVETTPAVGVAVVAPLQLLAGGQPQGANVPEGGSVSFTVAPTGGFPGLDYQWFDTSKALISGANDPTLTISGLTTADSGGYYCEITDSTVDTPVTIVSATAPLTVTAPLVALAVVNDPVDVEASIGDTAFFTVAVAGGLTGNYSYQWRKNGDPISGANGPVLIFPSVAEGDAGDYDVVVVDNLESVTSAVATLTVLPATPAVGGLGVAALVAAIAAAGALRKRRK